MSKALPGNNKTFDEVIAMTFYDVILYFRLCSGRKSTKSVFHSICLKFGTGGNFQMLITKRRPKLKLKNDLSQNMKFSTDFSQNYTKHSSTIALPWQQWMPYGTGLYLE